ncbi:MAG: M23 family metallopeptidase [Smithella sp.]|nr:M23 family metallopeptidase [Smithella sp.]
MKKVNGKYEPAEDKSITVVSNPGFAPVTTADTGIEYNGESYADCLSIFNLKRNGTNFLHTGVDLSPTGGNTKIKSFINGEVWSYTLNDDIYGNMMVIKGKGDYSDKLFVLCHLETNLLKPGDPVFPGEPVALTGTTGESTGIHLHLEVRQIGSGDEPNEYLTKEVVDAYKTKTCPPINGRPWKINNIGPKPRLNPFKHSDRLIGD